MLYGLAGDPLYNLWVFNQLNGAKLVVSAAYQNPDPKHILLPAQPLIDFQGWLFSKFFGPEAAYNIIIALGFILTFVAAYLLTKKITSNRLSAILSAVIITLLPYRLIHSQLHLNLISTQWILFFIYFLLLVREKTTIYRVGGLGLFAALTVLDNYQYGAFGLFCALVFVVYDFLCRYKNGELAVFYKTLKSLAAALAVTCILVLASDHKILLSIINGFNFANLGPTRDVFELKTYSTFWFYYLAPSPALAFLSGPFAPLFLDKIATLKTNVVEQTIFLGFIPTAMALFALSKLPRGANRFKIGYFAVLAAVAVLLSLVFDIKIGGVSLQSPSAIIFHKFPIIRVYSRLGFLVGMSVALLAGWTFAALTSKFSRLTKVAILSGLCFLLVIEFMPKQPFPTINTSKVPAIYGELEKMPSGTVAEYPLLPAEEPTSYDYLLAQIHHQMPLLYGASPSSSGEGFRKQLVDPTNPQTIDLLKKANVSYLILHQDKYLLGDKDKYPREYNGGTIPEISSPDLELVKCLEFKCLYTLKSKTQDSSF